ncbi:MAG: cell division protein FtsA [Nitrospiraceae bacterium]|nr:cell division protein FtsA [Nitrospiraceae bacterium]
MIRPRKTDKRRNIIVGLDVGTTKICAVVGEVKDGRAEIISIGSAPSTGLRKGVVINIDSTVDSIRKAVKESETLAGFGIDTVHVGICGGHIKGFESYGAVGIKGKEVRQQDVERAIDSASVVYVPLDREVLHVIPTEFILDGQDGIKDPIGMSGVRLEVKVHIVTGAVTSVQNLLKCCEKAGLDVVDIVLEPIASAEAVLSEDEKDLGVALVDIGGGTTDIAVYRNGSLRHTSVLAIGGNHFTNDIAIGLRIPLQEAERIKKKYGCAVPAMLVDKDEDMDVLGADKQLRNIPRKYILEILQPRCEELTELIKQEITGVPKVEAGLSGIVLTGGSSLLSGIDRLVEAEIGIPVRIGIPEGTDTPQSLPIQHSIMTPVYSTGIGLVLHGSKNLSDGVFHGDVFVKIFDKMKDWVKNLIGFENQRGTGKKR